MLARGNAAPGGKRSRVQRDPGATREQRSFDPRMFRGSRWSFQTRRGRRQASSGDGPWRLKDGPNRNLCGRYSDRLRLNDRLNFNERASSSSGPRMAPPTHPTLGEGYGIEETLA